MFFTILFSFYQLNKFIILRFKTLRETQLIWNHGFVESGTVACLQPAQKVMHFFLWEFFNVFNHFFDGPDLTQKEEELKNFKWLPP